MSYLLFKNGQLFSRRSLLATLLIFIVTSLHHVYGAIVYDTPWRTHIVPFGGAILVISLLFMFLYKKYDKKIYDRLYMLISFLFFGLMIGVYEGLYNHLLKNALYFGGLAIETWRIFFPAAIYEVPNNAFFELTGILQFPLFLLQVYYLQLERKMKKVF